MELRTPGGNDVVDDDDWIGDREGGKNDWSAPQA